MRSPAVVLIVEDDESTLRAICRIIAKRNHVVGKRNRSEAIAELEKSEVLALVVDVTLPDGSGFDIIERARKTNRQLPALIVTGRTDRDTTNRAFDFDVELVVKPVDPGHLVRFVDRARFSTTSGVHRLEATIATWQTAHDLTPREVEVLRLVAGGSERAELAELLHCGEATAKSHVHNLLNKTHYKSLPLMSNDLLRDAIELDKKATKQGG